MQTALEALHLTKQFSDRHKSKKALDDVSLQIEKGSIFGIIGPSGAGKSTLLRCLSTLEPSFSGTISFEGVPLDFKSKDIIQKVRKQIGMIFQHFLLLESRTVFENILLPLELAKVPVLEREFRASELLKLVELEGKKDCYPTLLSGGEKQRVGIARALATSPQILFCDEATSSLDPKTTQEILHLLKKLNEERGVTIVLITHEMDVVRKICDYVAVIDQGKVIEHGKVLDLFSSAKHPLTRQLVQTSSHDLDSSLYNTNDPNLLLLRLHFKGDSAQKPILFHLISELQIEVNILSGWIDMIQSTSLGCLTITLKGPPEKQALAFEFLQKNGIQYEALS